MHVPRAQKTRQLFYRFRFAQQERETKRLTQSCWQAPNSKFLKGWLRIIFFHRIKLF